MTYTMHIETRDAIAQHPFPYVVTDATTGEVIGHYETRTMAQSVARQWRAATQSHVTVFLETEA